MGSRSGLRSAPVGLRSEGPELTSIHLTELFLSPVQPSTASCLLPREFGPAVIHASVASSTQPNNPEINPR
ncbi:hypothetical protein VTJ04DRAFT_2239 [Mycothermus thermophilus]|uniref:uncharacterized protein n=1 Tax=Humicola insolens TaxID=85995 RepID=UPI003742DC2E